MENKYSKKRKIIGITVLVLLIAALALITWIITKRLLEIGSAPEDVQKFVASFGYAGWLVGLGLQVLQIVVAFIPGEIIESGLGFGFGALGGTVLCYTGIAIGELVVFLMIRKLGRRAVEYFVPLEKLDKLKFINDEKKTKNIIFVLFLIPGTPKDLLTYFAPLTKISLSEFLSISLIARFPSVISSTIGGHLLSNKQYLYAVILYAVTGIVSLAGMKVYDIILKKKENYDAQKKSV